jgi:hypothetical protein
MKARQLIGGAAFPPEVLTVTFEAFDDAGHQMASELGYDDLRGRAPCGWCSPAPLAGFVRVNEDGPHEQERALNVGGQDLRVDIALAADGGGVAEARRDAVVPDAAVWLDCRP